MLSTFSKNLTFKIIANSFNVVFNIMMTLLLPKSLGLALFGLFEYVVEVSTQLMTFLQFNVRNYFLDELSKIRRKETFNWFICFLFFAFILCFIVVILGHEMYENKRIETTSNVVIGIIVSISFSILLIASLRSVGDAIGKTKYTERYHAVYKFFLVFVIGVLYYWGFATKLSVLVSYLLIGTGFSLYLIRKIWLFLAKESSEKVKNPDFNRDKLKKIYKDTKPLFVYSFFTLIVEFADRSIIQFIGGNEQQAYFGIASRFSVIAFMLSSSINPLIFREFSRASVEKNTKKLASIISNFMILLFISSAVIGIFLAVNANDILNLFYGDLFAKATIVFALMCIYPLQQSFGQLLNMLFFSTENIRSYRNIAIASTVLGMLLTYFLLMPHSYGGLEMSGTGLAIKRLITQFFGVTVSLFFFGRRLNFSAKKIYLDKIKSCLILVVLAFGINLAFANSNLLLGFELVLKGVIYLSLAFLIYWRFSRFFGIDVALTRIKTEFDAYKNSR